MNHNLYQVRPLSAPGWLQRLLRQAPPDNAVIEVNNLLATRDILHIQRSDIQQIESRYRLRLNTEYLRNMEEFYAVYLNRCINDKMPGPLESRPLQHLQSILTLDEASVRQLQLKLGEQAYRNAFHKTIQDGRLTTDKERFLAGLAGSLRLPQELTGNISSAIRRSFVETYIRKMIADQRVSPQEEWELENISQSLRVHITLNEQTRDQIRKLKSYWAIEHQALPVVQPGIVLSQAETCHMHVPNVRWHELRKERVRTSYTGFSGRIKIAKGFYLNSGMRSTQHYTVDTMKHIDTGALYLTNKRILFTGQKKNSHIRLDKILAINPYTDGVEIEKDAGKSPVLQIGRDADLFCMMLERLLHER